MPYATFMSFALLAVLPPRYGPDPKVVPAPLERAALDLVGPKIGKPATSGVLTLAARELARRAAAGDPDPLARGTLRTALDLAGAFDAGPIGYVARATPAAGAPAALAKIVSAGSADVIGAGVAIKDST